MTDRPLTGYRVVDLTSVVMGPLATQILADLGADVIVVERPEGDPNRYMSPGPHAQLSGQALNLMRGKRSVVIDIHDDAGREAFDRLVASSDVFVTNLRPGSRRRARLEPDDLRGLRPDLVYCAATGFAPDDPRADDPAYDDIIQSAGGMVDVHRRAGLGYTYSPTVVVDKVCGMAIAQAISAALLHRERTGEGADLMIAMNEVLTGFLLVEHGACAIAEPAAGPPGNARALNPMRRPLDTNKGVVGVLVYERHHFEGLMRAGGRTDLLDDPRFATRASRLEHLDDLYEVCSAIAGAMTTQELLDHCRAADVPAHRVVALEEIVETLQVDEHPVAGRYRRTPSLAAGRPARASEGRQAPLIGEHTTELLVELGYSPADAASMESTPAVGSR